MPKPLLVYDNSKQKPVITGIFGPEETKRLFHMDSVPDDVIEHELSPERIQEAISNEDTPYIYGYLINPRLTPSQDVIYRILTNENLINAEDHLRHPIHDLYKTAIRMYDENKGRHLPEKFFINLMQNVYTTRNQDFLSELIGNDKINHRSIVENEIHLWLTNPNNVQRMEGIASFMLYRKDFEWDEQKIIKQIHFYSENSANAYFKNIFQRNPNKISDNTMRIIIQAARQKDDTAIAIAAGLSASETNELPNELFDMALNRLDLFIPIFPNLMHRKDPRITPEVFTTIVKHYKEHGMESEFDFIEDRQKAMEYQIKAFEIHLLRQQLPENIKPRASKGI